MQDRYAGDIGDYGKIGLLKCLQAHGFTIGVNWYRVPELDMEKKEDGTFKQDDGKYLIPDKLTECDPVLAEKLTRIAGGDRSVVAIQNAGLIPGAVYHDEFLTVDGREGWNERAAKLFADVDLVFMDPDNGLLVKSVSKRSKRSVKYAFYEEVKRFIDDGKSVLLYNHRCRKPERQYFDDIEINLEEQVKIYRYMIQTITFPKGTVRDYFAIPACKEHYDMFHAALTDMKYSKWGQLGVCRLFPEWADKIHHEYRTYEEHYFLDVESNRFIEGCSFTDYRLKIIRYLMLCEYKYSEEEAVALVLRFMGDIRISYKSKEPVANVALDIGYACG